MIKTYDIKLKLLFMISMFLHLLFFIMIILPNYQSYSQKTDELLKKMSWGGGRDIIVNINPDGDKLLNDTTLLSDVDSSAQGYITREPGDRWLNNSLDFFNRQGTRSVGRNRVSYPRKVENVILSTDSEIALLIKQYNPDEGAYGSDGADERIRIPDKNGVNMKNAIFYSNNGLFSFNTVKFKNFKYFKEMKDKISSNWILPGMANIAFGPYNPVTGAYSTARGYERYMPIPSQHVKIFFTMNRKGDILKVILIDSMGNRHLDNSCIDAIRLSVGFGPVPDDMRGEEIGIPFIFGFYAY